MGTVARWGDYKFEISSDHVNAIYDFSTTFSMKEDSNSDTSGTKKTNTRGREMEEPSFTVDYVAAAGCTPRNDFTQWRSLLGKRNYLYIGTTKYGVNPFELKSVDVEELVLDSKGRTAKATITLNFLEIKTKKSSSSQSTKQGAKNAKPSKSDAKSKSTYTGKGKK